MRGWSAGFAALVLVGCQAPLGDDSVEKSTELAKNLWITAGAEAKKITAEAPAPTIKAAQHNLERLQYQLSRIRVPNNVDNLRLANVEEELERLSYGLDMNDLREKLDVKIASAKTLVANAGKSVAELRAELKKKDAEFRDLAEQYNLAKANFDAAASRVADIRKKLEKVGAILP